MKNLHLFLIIFLVNQGVQAQYYVSPAGSNNNPGTLQLPFKTIQKAADIMIAGEICFIMNGEYRETVSPVNNGTADNPIVFTNYNDERVVILGCDSVSGWVPYQNGIYKTYMPDTISQLFANKIRAYPARYPDFFGGDMFNTSDWNPVTAESDGDAFLQGMNKPENYWVGGYCKILTGSHWVAHIGKISASDGDMVHCDERSSPWNDYNPGVYLGSGMGYIYKHLHALDKVNEWHWQNDTLYYFPESGANIDTMIIEARTRLYGFDCKENNLYRLYYNGELVSGGANTTCPNNTNPWRIGAHFNQQGWDAHFNGKIDEIRVYGRALSPSEIEDLYNGNTTGSLNYEINDDGIIIYPNPGSSKFYFSGIDKKISGFEVFNHLGQKIFEKKVVKEINLSTNPDSINFVVFLDENKQVLSSRKIIKN